VPNIVDRCDDVIDSIGEGRAHVKILRRCRLLYAA
jgi:hypothetical protein